MLTTLEVVADGPEIKDWYEHEHRPSVFVMFTHRGEVVWSYSLRKRAAPRIPGEAVRSHLGPIEVPIPDYVDRALTELWDNQDAPREEQPRPRSRDAPRRTP